MYQAPEITNEPEKLRTWNSLPSDCRSAVPPDVPLKTSLEPCPAAPESWLIKTFVPAASCEPVKTCAWLLVFLKTNVAPGVLAAVGIEHVSTAATELERVDTPASPATSVRDDVTA